MSKDFLSHLPPVVIELGELFHDHGYELSLVGGPVRDMLLNREAPDLDFTTSATPDQILEIVRPWADNVWEIGKKFGTIALQKHGKQLEVTTYRAESYDPKSRKPEVSFGTSLQQDLVRRDFTVNALAIRLPSGELVDVTCGQRDLEDMILRTPGTPEQSFGDDPLRIMRAARFVSQLEGFIIADDVHDAMMSMRDRLEIVSRERIRDELVKLMCGQNPANGIDIMRQTKILPIVLPEVDALQLEIDEHHHHKDVYEHTLTVLQQAIDLETDADGPCPRPDFILRMAALMHDVGKPPTRKFEPNGMVSFYHHDVVGAKMTRKRMRELRFDKATIRQVSRLVELHLRFFGYSDAAWTDSGVRRYITDAGEALERLHRVTRADVTTKNKKKALKLKRAYDDLEHRIEALKEQEKLDAVRPDLNGHEMMEILGIQPGRELGAAYRYMLEQRMEQGPMEKEAATIVLKKWWEER